MANKTMVTMSNPKAKGPVEVLASEVPTMENRGWSKVGNDGPPQKKPARKEG
ncbi:hypothetical protein [Pelagibius sp.]|uniref:hypothetical protein n=1 Tax=Pelagibius sp. TaxID=1931238 RepID=UPI00262A03AA|nr:hypothetical protein [Pelagibius sp.]